MAIPSETMRAYLAGFFDGEGYLGIVSSARKNGHVTMYTRLGVYNTDKEPLYLFAQALRLDGNVYVHSRVRGHKPCFQFATGKQNIIKQAIEMMLPYLIIKKERAELLLRFIESRGAGKTRRHFSDGEIKIYHRLRALNHQGMEVNHGDSE